MSKNKSTFRLPRSKGIEAKRKAIIENSLLLQMHVDHAFLEYKPKAVQ